MCGIAGFRGRNRGHGEDVVRRMTGKLGHRGPDHEGAWGDPAHGLWLGHARLSILDLSPNGHQPMSSGDGRFVITYNGEIYNFRALRESLESLGHSFHGGSDTEVVLASVVQWGLAESLKRFNGMFAMSLWDRKEGTLFLARDRMGEKPMYYGFANSSFLFASELKAIVAHPDFEPRVDRDALALYLRFGQVPAPRSIYQGTWKLPAGTFLALTAGAEVLPAPVPYWSLSTEASRGAANRYAGAPEEAIDELEALLKDSVKLRMESDVPLGAFLSGGVDSSTVAALMASQTDKPVRTFTVGFDSPGFDESAYARDVAAHLGTDHTEMRLAPSEALAVIPRLPDLYDEPFADSSQIPTFLVSQLARRKVVVSLSGDGGDELFGGYNRYFVGRALWNKIGWMPYWLRGAAARSLRAPRPSGWDAVAELAAPLLRNYGTRGTAGDKYEKIADVLSMKNSDALYERLVSNWSRPDLVLSEGAEPGAETPPALRDGTIADVVERMMFRDTASYLPDDLLVKLDRASMGVGLEGRVPLLDHRVVEFSWRLPLAMKIRGGEGKWILRRVLERHVPRRLFERPKMGFGIPLAAWLRGELREWAEALLDPALLKREGYFQPDQIQIRWKEHQDGVRDWANELWVILMFQAWLQNNPRVGAPL